jgi:diguanylate cyclase (GGDEF)-like protein
MHCRQSDIPIRWSGEEFAILLPETDLAGGIALAERIRQTVDVHKFENVEHITASFGVASLQTDGQDLITRSDSALYEAKKSGGNKVVSRE